MFKLDDTEQLSREDFYTKLVNTIWETTGDIQIQMLDIFRQTKRECSLDVLIRYKAFFILDNTFLLNVTAGQASSPNYGLYYGENCIFEKRLVIPIWGFNGKVQGFVGYDDGSEIKTEEEQNRHIPYLYLNANYFKKERNWLIMPEDYYRARRLGYICITDGVFDQIALTEQGHPAASILSSSFSLYHAEYMRYIPNWIIVADNDAAGTRLFNLCRYYNKNTIRLKFGKGSKDIDDRHKLEGFSEDLKRIFNQFKKEGYRLSGSMEYTSCRRQILQEVDFTQN